MNWLLNFKPKIVMFAYPWRGDEDAIMVQAVCADRIFRVRHKVAIRNASGDKIALKFLGTPLGVPYGNKR